jgi:uncharacterized protein
MARADIRGQWALVTGASSGLGVDFARILAEYGANLVLAARRQQRLEQVRDEITAQYGIQVEIIRIDLAQADAPQLLYDDIHARGIEIDILINNAGSGVYGEFVHIDWEREKAMLDLDIIALTHLTKLYLRDMVERDQGYILQVASIGAYQPSPLYATYAAAKAYVLNFSQAVSYELRHTNVHMAVVSPGITRSEFLEVAGQQPTLYQRLTVMASATVTRQAIDGMLRGRVPILPGLLTALTARGVRLIPRWLAAAFAYRTMR